MSDISNTPNPAGWAWLADRCLSACLGPLHRRWWRSSARKQSRFGIFTVGIEEKWWGRRWGAVVPACHPQNPLDSRDCRLLLPGSGPVRASQTLVPTMCGSLSLSLISFAISVAWTSPSSLLLRLKTSSYIDEHEVSLAHNTNGRLLPSPPAAGGPAPRGRRGRPGRD